MIMKRFLDVILSAAALVVLAPLLIVIWMLIRVTMGAPAIFTQRRPGLGGRPFMLFKFRTMQAADSADVDTDLDQHRLTRLGRMLRSTSLDELPELWNILRGDMSMVGPRPLLEEYLPEWMDALLFPGAGEHWMGVMGPLLILLVLFARGGIHSLLGRLRIRNC